MGNSNIKESDEFAIQDFTEFFDADKAQIRLFKTALRESRKKEGGDEFEEKILLLPRTSEQEFRVQFQVTKRDYGEQCECPGYVRAVSETRGLTYIYGLGIFPMSEEFRVFLNYLGIEVIIGEFSYIVKTRNPVFIHDVYMYPMSFGSQKFELRFFLPNANPPDRFGLVLEHMNNNPRWLPNIIKRLASAFPGISYEDYLLFREELLVEEALRETQDFSLPAIGLKNVKNQTKYLRERKLVL